MKAIKQSLVAMVLILSLISLAQCQEDVRGPGPSDDPTPNPSQEKPIEQTTENRGAPATSTAINSQFLGHWEMDIRYAAVNQNCNPELKDYIEKIVEEGTQTEFLHVKRRYLIKQTATGCNIEMADGTDIPDSLSYSETCKALDSDSIQIRITRKTDETENFQLEQPCYATENVTLTLNLSSTSGQLSGASYENYAYDSGCPQVVQESNSCIFSYSIQGKKLNSQLKALEKDTNSPTRSLTEGLIHHFRQTKE